MEEIKGYVEHIVYRNDDNGYTVFELSNDDGEVTCVGTLACIQEGEMLKISGQYKTHPVYGEQLQVLSYELLEPEDLISIERYLGSGAIKGLGPAFAGRIVRRFKGDTFRIIEEEPERLVEVKGIGEQKAREIAAQVEEKKDMRKAMIYLQKYGISISLSAKIYEYYGQKVYSVLEENPYQIADRIPGVGFRTADDVARRMGICVDSDYRIQSGIVYALLQATNEGHIYLPERELVYRTKEILGIELQDISQHLLELSMAKKIIVKEKNEEKRIYASQYYYMELNTASMLKDLNIDYEVSITAIEQRIFEIEKQSGMQLDDKQRQAVIEAARHGILILTGGPGTGKTTTINTMIQFFERDGMDIYLAAPTGRAAKRMTEATGYEAKTIHRMLELSNILGEEDHRMHYGRNEENPLEADVIIVDEMSMVDLPLMCVLLRAILVGTRVIFVGDQDQLPSVGPGSVLKDLIDSKCFPVVKLTKIFRQAGESDIVVNAHKINRGETLILDNKSRDFFFLKRQDADTIIRVVLTLIQSKLPKYVDADPLDIQVLTPTRKGLLGVERLNTILQQYMNPPHARKAEKEYRDKIFRVGDKVMQIRNNYQLEWEISTKQGLVIDAGMGVFNGDIGKIIDINTYTQTIQVEFEEKKKVNYSYELLEELELAYAVTVHKSQGSEYPAVVIPLLQGPRQLYYRNLIYTAVTRAKKCVTIVGDDEILQEMIRNTKEQERYTSLAETILSLRESE